LGIHQHVVDDEGGAPLCLAEEVPGGTEAGRVVEDP
jgi:hypothetical protein